MIISHDHKFIFFAVGKTGTHSVESVLQKYASNFELSKKEERFFQEHIPPYYLREKLSEEIWNSYFKFAFVRNPWDMVISNLFWNDLVAKDIDFIRVEDVHKLYENQKKYRRGIDWCESREQHAFLADKAGERLVDRVGRFEKIQEDFAAICRAIGVPPEPLPVLNARRHKPYREYYTPQTIEAVRKLWSRDIEAFGYEFDSPTAATQADAVIPPIDDLFLPVPHEGVAVKRVHGELILENTEKNTRILLNATGIAVWELCNGERSVGDISSELAEHFSAPVEVIAQDVKTVVRSLSADGVLQLHR